MIKRILEKIKIYLYIVKANTIYTFQQETAYALSNWIGILATIVFSTSQIILVEVIFGNIDSLAPMSKDQVLFFFLVGHFSFFFNASFVSTNLYKLTEDVNKGDLDLVLTKPLPSLFYVSTKYISLMTLFRQGILGSLVFFILIDWSNLSFTLISLIVGIAVFLIGQYALYFIQFMMSIPVFWLGQSGSLIDFSYVFDYRLGRMVPYDIVGSGIRLFFSTFIPVMIGSGLSVSVIFGYTTISDAFQFLAILVPILYIVKSIMWSKALRAYTSASS